MADPVKSNRRADLRPGMTVRVILKQDQATGKLTQGIVQDILTRSASHPRGIKVRLEGGLIGRVQEIIPPSQEGEADAG